MNELQLYTSLLQNHTSKLWSEKNKLQKIHILRLQTQRHHFWKAIKYMHSIYLFITNISFYYKTKVCDDKYQM